MTKRYNDYFIVSDNNLSDFEKISILEIKRTILNYFQEIKIGFNYEVCNIQKSKLPYPIFYSKTVNKNLPTNLMFLAINDYSFWCQVVYQLSHELTHCFICSNNVNENNKASWIEETICESVSLYFLKYFFQNWKLCNLSKLNPSFNVSFNDYLTNILNKNGNNKLNHCKNLQELNDINTNSQNTREDRLENVKDLFRILNKSNIRGIIKYKDYIIPNTILLDSDRYINDYPNNEAIKYLCNIQKSIIKDSEIYVNN